MNLRINCDASVKLDKMTTISEISCKVFDYNVKSDTLRGNIKIFGKYLKDDLERAYEFEDIVPFTVVFKNDDFAIDEIYLENFKHQEIFNIGVDCDFDIIISYYSIEESNNPSPEVASDDINDQVFLDEALPIDLPIEHLAEEQKSDDEKFKEELEEKYNTLLDKVLNGRSDNFLDDQEPITNILEEAVVEEIPSSNVQVNAVSSAHKTRVLPKTKENFKTLSIYYTRNDSELETIAKTEQISIDKILENSSNSGGIRRTIIK